MHDKNSESIVSGSLVAFIILCVVWFLELSGLLRGLLN